MFGHSYIGAAHEPWNRGKLIGQKQPFAPQQIWSVRMHLQAAGNLRDLALFNLDLDSKLRVCDLLGLRVADIPTASTCFRVGQRIQRTCHSVSTPQSCSHGSCYLDSIQRPTAGTQCEEPKPC